MWIYRILSNSIDLSYLSLIFAKKIRKTTWIWGPIFRHNRNPNMNPMHSTRLLRGSLMWQVPAPINTTSEVVNIMKMEDVPMFWYDFPILHPFFHRSIGKCPYQVTKKHSAVAFWGLAGDSGAILAGPEVSIPGGHRSTERQWPHHDERRVPRPSDPRAPLDGGCFRCCNVQWAIQVEVDSRISINSWYSWSASPLVVGFVC